MDAIQETPKVYKKDGCNECVHADSKHDFVDHKYTLIERTCKMGHTDKLYKWWEDNGNKKSGAGEPMDCHEYGEHTKKLIDMCDMSKDILAELKELNASKETGKK